jgi:hypothetical protein
VVVDALKAKTDFWIDDVDIYFPYDGFTIIAQLARNVGYCGRGRPASSASNWDEDGQRILINDGARQPTRRVAVGGWHAGSGTC